MKRYFHPLIVLFTLLANALPAHDISPEVSTGPYQNPIIQAGYSDPDGVRAGDGGYVNYDWFRVTP